MSDSSLTWKDSAIVSTISGITTLNVFFNGALTVALPTIGKALNFKQADLQWPVNVFALSYGCLLLFFGRLGDIFGGRFMFLAGSAWFAVWSLACAFAPNDVAFIIFTALLGIGAAANTPSGIGLLAAYFPSGTRRNKAFGILGAGQPLGFILGIMLGGLLAQSKATWHSIFYIQTGLSCLLFTLGWFVLPKNRENKKYDKGLDWGGAFLSILGVGLLTYSLADSTSASKGWGTPHVIGTTIAAITLIVLFWYYEKYRESRDLSVLVPPKMWKQPGAKMIPMISMVFFAWYCGFLTIGIPLILIRWSFNTLAYFATLYYQQVALLDPLHTSLRFIPMVVAGLFANLIGGWMVNRIPGQPLMLVGILGNVAAPIIFALIDVQGSYWTMAFWVMVLVVGADIAYPVGALHLSSTFNDDSQSLAGGVFNVATRLGTSIGIAVTSSIATAVTQKYTQHHPGVSESSPEALMAGFRAAGWTLCAAAGVSIVIGLIGLRGIGIVGQKKLDSGDVSPGLTLTELPDASSAIQKGAGQSENDKV